MMACQATEDGKRWRKAMIECPHCQGTNEDGTAYCEQCGAEMPAQVPVPVPGFASALPPTPVAEAAPLGQPADAAISFVVSSPAGETRVSFRGQEVLCGRRDER